MRRVIAGAALLLTLTACGQSFDSQVAAPSSEVASPTPTLSPSPTPTRNVEYDSLEDLRDAAIAVGYPCEDWTQDDLVKYASESGTCSDGDVLSTYVSASDLQDQIDGFRDFDPDNEAGSVLLVGPNWMINVDHDFDVKVLQEGIGGKIFR